MEFPAEFLIQFSDVEKELELTLIAVCCSFMKEEQKETRTLPVCQPLSWDMLGHGVLNWWHLSLELRQSQHRPSHNQTGQQNLFPRTCSFKHRHGPQTVRQFHVVPGEVRWASGLHCVIERKTIYIILHEFECKKKNAFNISYRYCVYVPDWHPGQNLKPFETQSEIHVQNMSSLKQTLGKAQIRHQLLHQEEQPLPGRCST